MSATRDKTQKFTFVYSNFHELYRRAKEEAKSAKLPSDAVAADLPTAVSTEAPRSSKMVDENPAAEPRPFSVRREFERSAGRILKTAAVSEGMPKVTTPEMPPVTIKPYTPVELIGKRVAKPSSLDLAKKLPAGQALPPSNPAIDSLKQNLHQLKDLHSRLRFMLQELEELVKE